MERGMKILTAILALFLTVFAVSPASAEYPEKPTTMYVVFAPGGSMDSSARALALGAEPILGKPIVIVNKEGGGGTVGLGVLAGDNPDGYTIAAATSTGILRIPMQRQVPYKPLASFTPIVGYAAVISALVVNPDSPYKTLKDLVDYAKANPGKIKYSTAGTGSPMHIAMEVIAMKEGIKWIHIPFPGSAPAETALMGGHVDACSTGDMDKALTGQLRTLAVHSQERMKQLPDAPTLIELGYDYWNDTMFAVYGPAGMSPDVVKRLEEAFIKSVDTERFQRVAGQFMLQPMKMGNKEYTKFLEDSWPKEGERLKAIGLIQAPATAPR
jgi:tripartite-type tricarboxylate transporter receptor subunit TctC